MPSPVLGRRGAAVINAQGGLSWEAKSTHPDDVYVHLANQKQLNRRIDALLTVAATPNRAGQLTRSAPAVEQRGKLQVGPPRQPPE